MLHFNDRVKLCSFYELATSTCTFLSLNAASAQNAAKLDGIRGPGACKESCVS